MSLGRRFAGCLGCRPLGLQRLGEVSHRGVGAQAVHRDKGVPRKERWQAPAVFEAEAHIVLLNEEEATSTRFAEMEKATLLYTSSAFSTDSQER